MEAGFASDHVKNEWAGAQSQETVDREYAGSGVYATR
jgi:hypothetical protein